MKQDFPKKIGIYLLTIFFLLIGLGSLIIPVNEYQAMGLDLVDCDGAELILIAAILSLLFFLILAFFLMRKLFKKFNYLILLKIILAILFCVLLGNQALKAFNEIELNQTIYSEIC